MFEPGETEKTIDITILDDEEVEEDEEFVVVLTSLEASEGIACRFASAQEQAVVTIIDDDEPGVLAFKAEDTKVVCSESQGFVEIIISRMQGSAGQIGCTVKLEELTALVGKDFAALPEADRVVTFETSQVCSEWD